LDVTPGHKGHKVEKVPFEEPQNRKGLNDEKNAAHPPGSRKDATLAHESKQRHIQGNQQYECLKELVEAWLERRGQKYCL
jgi:hypothetical protein